MLVLAPRAWRDRARVALEARVYRKPVIIVSVLGPLGYILVLFAMRLAPVSHVAPARELSTLVGAWFGSRLLREDSGPWRIVGAALIVAGVIALALRVLGGRALRGAQRKGGNGVTGVMFRKPRGRERGRHRCGGCRSCCTQAVGNIEAGAQRLPASSSK